MDGMATRCKVLTEKELARPHLVHTVHTVHPFLVIFFKINPQIEVCPFSTAGVVHTIRKLKYGQIDPSPLFCKTANNAFDFVGKLLQQCLYYGCYGCLFQCSSFSYLILYLFIHLYIFFFFPVCSYVVNSWNIGTNPLLDTIDADFCSNFRSTLFQLFQFKTRFFEKITSQESQ